LHGALGGGIEGGITGTAEQPDVTGLAGGIKDDEQFRGGSRRLGGRGGAQAAEQIGGDFRTVAIEADD
jgi:hypothetical protein